MDSTLTEPPTHPGREISITFEAWVRRDLLRGEWVKQATGDSIYVMVKPEHPVRPLPIGDLDSFLDFKQVLDMHLCREVREFPLYLVLGEADDVCEVGWSYLIVDSSAGHDPYKWSTNGRGKKPFDAFCCALKTAPATAKVSIDLKMDKPMDASLPEPEVVRAL